MSEKEYLEQAAALFREAFNEEPTHDFVSYGRLELCGNHTDHNHGLCLVGTCSLSIKGAVKEDENQVTIKSDGYKAFSVDINNLEPKDSEKSTSVALTKGVLYKLKELGYKIGGFKAAMNSNIFSGAGVSSSAAYELFVAEVINALYNEDKIDRLTLAKVGQFAENEFFGKRSGLLDQCGSSFGGVCALDFNDPANAGVEPIKFPNWPLKIYLVNPGMSHAHMDNLYSSIPDDMKMVAKAFGKSVLREVDESTFNSELSNLKGVSNFQKKRAIHFMNENKRVARIIEAVKSENMADFIQVVRECEKSQEDYLKNVVVPGKYKGSPLEAVRRANKVLKVGTSRVMGGGFAGSIICLVPSEEEKAFLNQMNKYYAGRVVEVSIPPVGAHEVK